MSLNDLSIEYFVSIAECLQGSQFVGQSPFELVGKNLGKKIEQWLDQVGVKDQPIIHGTVSPHAHIEGPVYIEKGAVVEPTAFIAGPTYIAEGAEIRHGAYIRGNAYIGPGSVVGHATEVKGSIFFDGAKAGHFAYVGDSILGRSVNLGAGTKLANLALRRKEVRVVHPESGKILGTGLTKFGSVMGDFSQTGCNAVLSPGTLLCPKVLVGPCDHFRGTRTENGDVKPSK